MINIQVSQEAPRTNLEARDRLIDIAMSAINSYPLIVDTGNMSVAQAARFTKAKEALTERLLRLRNSKTM